VAGAVRTASSLSGATFERILLVKPSSLGDVVHALPVLHGLRAHFPQAKIDWLIASQLAPLLHLQEQIDELVLFDRRRFSRVGRSPQVTREFVGFVRSLRARRYELVVDLQGLLRTGFLTWTSGAPVRIGFQSAREGASLFYTHRIRSDVVHAHAVDRNLKVLELLGCQETPVRFGLTLSDRARFEARLLVDETNIERDGALIVVAPGARWETKVWVPARFSATIDEIRENMRARCVLIGTPNERPLCERIAATCRSAPLNLAGRTSLPQMAAVVELADMVLCHDSAVAHLAVAFDRPLACLVGPTNPQQTGPYRRPEDVVQLKLDCSPCYKRRLPQCPHEHRCMTELDVPRVVAAVEQRLTASAVHPT